MPIEEEADGLADAVERDIEKAIEKLRYQRGELYNMEHTPGVAEPVDPGKTL